MGLNSGLQSCTIKFYKIISMVISSGEIKTVISKKAEPKTITPFYSICLVILSAV